MLAGMLRRTINGSHNFQTLTHHYFSTSSVAAVPASHENPVLLDFLVKSLGFSRDIATPISTKFTLVKSTHKPEQVVDYLKTSGFSESQIRKLVSSHPRVLFNNVDKTLKPKIKDFESLGLSLPDIRTVLSSNPLILQRGLTEIGPALEALKSFFTDPENVFRVVLESRRFISPIPRSNIIQNITLLKSYDVPMERIEKLMVQGNSFLWSDTKRFEKVLKRVEEELHIPRETSTFLDGVCVLASITKETINGKLEVFKSFGWSEKDFFEMTRRHPYSLRTSENVMRVRLKYFMEELGCQSEYLASHSALLLFSTKKWVKPRNHVLNVLKEKELLKDDPSLYSFMLEEEKDFTKKYVIPFDTKVPGLYKEYLAMTKSKERGSSVKDV